MADDKIDTQQKLMCADVNIIILLRLLYYIDTIM